MVGVSDSMVIVSMWASMSAWCTPTMLFCFMNLIIATIFIASKSPNPNTKHHGNVQWNSFGPIGRVSSFLERAKSVNLPSFITTTTAAAAGESQDEYPSSPKTPTYSSSSRLAQSIHFLTSDETQTSLRSSKSSPPENYTGEETSKSESQPPPPSLIERVKSVNFSESHQICNSPGQLVRVPSLFHRIKSFKISAAFNHSPPENVDTEHHVIKSKSEKTPAKIKKPVVEMKKSRSEMRLSSDDDEDVNARRPATARAARNADDEEFDLKADDFISRFKQQLKLQRLESLVRYRDMLKRGT